MHVTYQVYTFINIINLSIQIYPYKTELDLSRIRLNGRLNSCLARLIFQTSCLTIHLIQIFCINILYFVMTYFIIRDTLIIIYLFYNLHKFFE